MNTILLDTIMRHLNDLPDLDATARALIFDAYDKAPDNPICQDDHDGWEAHLRSGGWQAWKIAREIPLHVTAHRYYGGVTQYHPLTLDEIAGGEAAPTKTEILTVLARAAERVKESVK